MFLARVRFSSNIVRSRSAARPITQRKRNAQIIGRYFSRTTHNNMTDWKKASESELTAFQKSVLWDKATEPAGSGEYDKLYPKTGYFACRACKSPLYSAVSKFHSGCGWPAFDKCYKDAIHTETDKTFGIIRVEIMCATCGGHLGHVFEGERFTTTDERHCVNSASVVYVDAAPPTTLQESKVLPAKQ